MVDNFAARGYPEECYKKYSDLVDIANHIREKGQEYGTTTGRPRRIGWFDINSTIKAVELTGATEIALMHL